MKRRKFPEESFQREILRQESLVREFSAKESSVSLRLEGLRVEAGNRILP